MIFKEYFGIIYLRKSISVFLKQYIIIPRYAKSGKGGNFFMRTCLLSDCMYELLEYISLVKGFTASEALIYVIENGYKSVKEEFENG